jgi:hypothetical protein
MGEGAVTVMAVLRDSEPVHWLPQDGQLPSGYDAISSGVSTRLPQDTHLTESVEEDGCHLEPLGIVIMVSVMVC